MLRLPDLGSNIKSQIFSLLHCFSISQQHSYCVTKLTFVNKKNLGMAHDASPLDCGDRVHDAFVTRCEHRIFSAKHASSVVVATHRPRKSTTQNTCAKNSGCYHCLERCRMSNQADHISTWLDDNVAASGQIQVNFNENSDHAPK